MLRIYRVSLELVRMVVPLAEQIARHDAELGAQCRNAITRVPLNIAEGMYSRGGNRTSRYHFAMGSAREALSCLEVAEAVGYLPPIERRIVERFDHVIGTLVNLVKPRAA